jgi:hypothetical protein
MISPFAFLICTLMLGGLNVLSESGRALLNGHTTCREK